MLLGLLIAFHLGHNALAISQDTYPMIPDAKEYFEWSGQMAPGLHAGRLGDVHLHLWGNPLRPPFGIIPATVLQGMAGKADPLLARMSTLFWLALLLLATYLIARRLHSPDAGLLAVASLAAMPAVMGFSRLLWLDIPLAAMCALSIHQLLRTDCFSSLKQSLLLGVVAGLGLLTKPSLPIFVGPLAAVLLIQGLCRPGHRLRVLGAATLSAALALAFLSLWLVPHFSAFSRQSLVAAAGGGWSRLLGAAGNHGPESFTFYLQHVWWGAIGPPLSALFLLGIVGALWRREGHLVAAISAVWLCGSLLGLASFYPWLRYFIPAMPAVAIVVGAGLLQFSVFASRRLWAVPLICSLLALFSIQQTWFGPELYDCSFIKSQETWNRPLCAGMVRPYSQKIQRPDLSGLPPRESKIDGAVVPERMAPTPAPLPFDCLGETLSQWFLIDLQQSADFNYLRYGREITKQDLDSFHVLALAEPHAPWKVPDRDQSAHHKVKQLLRENSAQWKKAVDFNFPAVARLRIFYNKAHKARTRGAEPPIARP